MKKRLHELSKELGVENKLLVTICQQIGIPVRSHASMLDPVETERVRIALRARGHKIPPPGSVPPKGPEKPSGGGAQGAAAPGDSKSPFTVKVIEEKAKGFGAEVRHVKLEKVIRRGPMVRRPGAPAIPSGHARREEPVAARTASRAAEEVRDATQGKTFEVEVPISLKNLSAQIGVKTADLIRALMELGVMATINQVLDAYAVGLIGEKLGISVRVVESLTVEQETVAAAQEKDAPEDLVPRSPVVTVMGHVDHGKTTLLDRIRKTRVAEGEVGGITQHIGASRVEIGKRAVVFLDTPGHAAFTRMRSRGANVTDLVVLVVAADDGVMPQTEEAVNHAKAAGVPVIVAVNKVDKKDANPRRVMEDLSKLGLIPEAWGGKTGYLEISALSGQGLPELLERVFLEAEVLDLKANPKKPALGVVIEANRSEAFGTVATVLVRDGTLRVGDLVACGHAFGKVRSMADDRGRPVAQAGPSTPVRFTGLSEVPEAGAVMHVVADLDIARRIALERGHKLREAEIARKQHVTLESLFEHIEQKKAKELNVIVKADVRGSVEVVAQALQDLSTDEVKLRVLHQGVGAVSESDVLLAHASDAVIVGFHVVPDERSVALAGAHGVEIRTYQVIYKMTEDIAKSLEGMLEPESREVTLGRLEIRQTFRTSRAGVVAGCLVAKGLARRGASVRVVRDGRVVHEGKLDSLRRFKDDVREVKEGLECGAHVEGYDDVKPGDRLDVFEVQKVARVLSKATSPSKN